MGDNRPVIRSGHHQPRTQGDGRLAVHHYPHRLAHLALQPAIQHRVIRPHRSNPHHNRHTAMPQPVPHPPCLLTRHPLGISIASRNFPIQGHGVFHHHPRAALRYVFHKSPVQTACLLLTYPHFDLHSRLTQQTYPLPRHQRIRIFHPHNHPFDSRFENRLCARRRLPVMATRLQSHIQSRPIRALLAIPQRIPLRMPSPETLMPPLSDNPSVADYHRANQRIGIHPTLAAPCQIQGTLHKSNIFFCHHTKKP